MLFIDTDEIGYGWRLIYSYIVWAPDGYVVLKGILPHECGLSQGAHEGGLHRDEQLGVAHPDVLRHVPGEVHHRHNRLVSLRLVPLVPEWTKKCDMTKFEMGRM